MNTYLKNQPAVIQFLAFLALAAGFFGLYMGISSLLFKNINAVLLNKNAVVSSALIWEFKWAQLTASVISFILPALLFGYYSSPEPLSYVGIRKKIYPVLLAASIVLLLCITPFIGWLGEVNAKATFGSMQKSMLQMEAEYNRVLQVFLQMKTGGELIMNLLIMALLPAVGEELFFRGSLQKVLLRLIGRPWIAIVVSAVVFALLHGTFFKILPIFALGLLLGTVYHITQNIWYTFAIHFINNALAVLSVYYADKSEFLKKLAGDDISVSIYGAAVSLVIGAGLLYFIKRKSDEQFPAAMANEDDIVTL